MFQKSLHCICIYVIFYIVNTLLVIHVNIFVNLTFLFVCLFVEHLTTYEALLNSQVKQFIFCRNSNPLLFNFKLQQFFYN